jgi:hypothetical protein
MTNLDALLAELGRVDRQLAGTAEDFTALRQLLERRAVLIEQASSMIDSPRGATAEQKEILLQSERAGSSLMRQLIQARHILSRELSQLKQEHRLWDALTEGGMAVREIRLDVKG